MGAFADIAVYFAALTYIVIAVPTLGVLGFAGVVANRSGELARRGGCRGYAGCLFSALFSLAAVLVTVIGLIALLFFPTKPPPTESQFHNDVLFVLLFGLILEFVGYFIQWLFQRWMHVTLPTE
jgi:hypothetical protein